MRFTDRGGTGVVLRFAAFYGPDAWQLTDMIAFVRRGWMPLLGPARSFFPSISHDDAAAAVVSALGVAPGIYNVTDDEPLRHREFAGALADALSLPPPRLPPAWMAYLAGSVGRMMARSLRLGNAKLRTASNWRPRYPSAREGLRATVAALPAAAVQGAGRSTGTGTSTAASCGRWTASNIEIRQSSSRSWWGAQGGGSRGSSPPPARRMPFSFRASATAQARSSPSAPAGAVMR